jgi:hypothetical protein
MPSFSLQDFPEIHPIANDLQVKITTPDGKYSEAQLEQVRRVEFLQELMAIEVSKLRALMVNAEFLTPN